MAHRPTTTTTTTTSVLEDFLWSDNDDIHQPFQPSPDLLCHRQLQMIHLPSVTSTQDEVKRILLSSPTTAGDDDNHHHHDNRDYTVLAVMANEQTAGRGTQGRSWASSSSSSSSSLSASDDDDQQQPPQQNLYLTLALPMQVIPIQPLTLLPLQVGVWVAQRVHTILQSCSCGGAHHADCSGGAATTTTTTTTTPTPKVIVKWPNDVLIDRNNRQEQQPAHKVSGTLIETCQDRLLIGIGVNVLHRPTLTGLPGQHGRAAACLQDFCATASSCDNTTPNKQYLKPGTAAALGWDLALAATEWVTSSSLDGKRITMSSSLSPQQRGLALVDEWSSWAEFEQVYELRGQCVDVEAGGYQGEKVVTLGIAPDGQLRVRGANGQERLLSAEYLV